MQDLQARVDSSQRTLASMSAMLPDGGSKVGVMLPNGGCCLVESCVQCCP